MCENPHVDMNHPAVAELMADVSAALARRVNALCEDICEVTLREIPQLNGDTAVFADTAEDPRHDQQPKESR